MTPMSYCLRVSVAGVKEGDLTGREERCRYSAWEAISWYRKCPPQLQVNSGRQRGYQAKHQQQLLQPLSANLRKDPVTFLNCENTQISLFCSCFGGNTCTNVYKYFDLEKCSRNMSSFTVGTVLFLLWPWELHSGNDISSESQVSHPLSVSRRASHFGFTTLRLHNHPRWGRNHFLEGCKPSVG